MRNILVTELRQVALEEQPLEICERKGLGHPDSICDAVMNQVSIELSKEYLRRFGAILHHNLDKGLLAAGEARVKFGGGEILRPMRIIYGDRATFRVGDEQIPVDEIAIRSTTEWLRRNLRFVDPDVHVTFQSEIKPGAKALQDIFERKGRFLGANDTSATVGFAPLTETEGLILGWEDIKIMGLRRGRVLDLTVAMALVDRFISGEGDYFRKKAEIEEAIDDFISANYGFEEVNLGLNVLDAQGRGIEGLYLTVLGTSAEGGDSGQVGRGNNVIGVIPLNRPVSSEAAAGKNPVSHVGKIYNILSYRIADQVSRRVNGVKETYIWLLSSIGQPIDMPKVVSAQVILEDGVELGAVSPEIEETIAHEFEHLEEFCMDLAHGRINIC
ncbi:S-adenosylmethionine synthetase [miscellaneous Crenarchaeota group-15 archaeon DG-45]|uniref:S-adenosylmethionine synthetase n=1 Tax=miscellaneous Crenarchaeota group-15 archaeon DG-45 TaxID=1685127 RepID=A0A0M0BKQ9_9ARCH|nr:MAG: S-adenosylmethionine synthetase [miscellaneous Crenarchaeota group-15 archaeon DG-45]